MSSNIQFRVPTLADGDTIRAYALEGTSRNCDLNFMNIMSWRFLYDTQMAIHNGWLLFRFTTEGHLAYLFPMGKGDFVPVVKELMADAAALGHPFLMLGVQEDSLNQLNEKMPDYFHATYERDFSDYVYKREALATLAGKKLQAKRNHAHRFEREYPNYEYLPLTKELIPECLRLEQLWAEREEREKNVDGYTDEKRSMQYVFDNWEHLGGTGGVIKVDGQLVAFTFGAPINSDTFDVCVEKADTDYEGSFTIINRDFVRHLPEQFTYINREEDMGLEGLRHAKESYHPEILLTKYAVMAKHPFRNVIA